MTSPITRYIYQKSIYNSNNYQRTHSNTSQAQQDDFNKEIFKQNLEGTIITIFLIIVVLLCVAIYEKFKKD